MPVQRMTAVMPMRSLFSRNIASSSIMWDRVKGTVKWFSVEKGFGFICPHDGGDDLFVHYSCIRSDGFRSLADGEEVEFVTAQDERTGKVRAEDVTGPEEASVVGSQRNVRRDDEFDSW